ncbi:unnamed protein product [Pylaiella littoralis]
MENSGKMRSLEDSCFLMIAQNPDLSLKAERVERALFSKRARQLVRRSTDMGAAGGGGGTGAMDTVRLRQKIITKLVDEGRGMAGSFPAPKAFLDDSFTSISLTNSKIGDSFVRDTLSVRCPMLRSVDLTACFYLRDASIAALLSRCPLVERLTLRNCRKLTDTALEHVVRDGVNIAALDIGGCFNITAAGADGLCAAHPNASGFTELDISGIMVTTHTLEMICQHCRSLEILRMGFAEYMEATLTKTLPPLAANLRSLHVHWNTCVTDEFLSWAVKSMPRLEDLNLCGCSKVSSEGVSAMLYDRRKALEADEGGKAVSVIQEVNVRYTSLTKQDAEALQAEFQGTKIVLRT